MADPSPQPVRTWRWAPHKRISIEITSEPGFGPHVDVCDQGHEPIEVLDRIIGELHEARRIAFQLSVEHEVADRVKGQHRG